MNEKQKPILFAIVVLLVVGLATYFLLRRTGASAELHDAGQDARQVGHDAANGVKDAYDATKDAVHDAVK